MTKDRRPQRQLLRGIVVVAAVGAAAAVLAQGHDGPRGERSVVAQSRFAVTDPSAQTELVQLVVDFAPGAWTSLHTHGGQAINLVLEGEITLRHGRVEKPHRAGQSWTDSPTQVHAAGNTGAGKARLLTSLLLPKGAPQITVLEESGFGPSIAHEARFALPALPAEAEIVQQVVDLHPGWRAERTLSGFAASLVIEGEVTYRIGNTPKGYRSGDPWSARAGTRITEDNRSHASVRVFTTYLVPRGAGP